MKERFSNSMSNRSKPPFVIGHRGAKGEAPENTLLGIRYALDRGVDGIEIDVHLTADGQLVLIHDFFVERTTDGKGLVQDLTYDQIRRLDAGGGQRVPRLEEVFPLMGDKLLFIEVKCQGAEEKLLALVARVPHRDRITFKSFDHRIVKKLKELDRKARTACIIEGLPIHPHKLAADCQADMVSVSAYMTSRYLVDQCREYGLETFVWCAETRAEFEKFSQMGFDYICTSFPARILLP
jgi:glycerophosphoryl diester phosphodiesterase